MAVGTVSTSILTDIANAIRFQAGVATLYKPREMAAAVAALDGSYEGNYQAQPYKELESGVLPESVFEDIADAIRAQNGPMSAGGNVASAFVTTASEPSGSPFASRRVATQSVAAKRMSCGRSCARSVRAQSSASSSRPVSSR